MPRICGRTRPSAISARAFEHAADDALLPPDLALAELAVGDQAGELGAGAGAAGRAVVGPARGRARSSCCRAWGLSGGPNSSMWSISAPSVPVIPLRDQRLADPPGHVGQAFDVGDARGPRRARAPGRTSCRPRRRRRRSVRSPGTSTVDAFGQTVARRRCRSSRVLRPSRLIVTVPTGVSSRCEPGPIRPRWASATATPIVPWPHMPR